RLLRDIKLINVSHVVHCSISDHCHQPQLFSRLSIFSFAKLCNQARSMRKQCMRFFLFDFILIFFIKSTPDGSLEDEAVDEYSTVNSE
ncbi:hypothetical protein L9F63_006088, partial [Diploptera punctata]